MKFLMYRKPSLPLAISIIIIFCIGILAALVLFTNIHILSYQNMIVSPKDAPTTTQTLVFGAGMRDDGTQTKLQMDRVATAVSLYNANTVEKIAMTGDDGQNRYDEVTAMKEQAEQYKVPPADVLVDPHGYRTYESCWRAKHVYQYDTVLAVSQDFHLPRILYICNSLGVNTIGVSANIHEYSGVWYTGYVAGVREVLARLKAWWQVEVTQPLPRVTY